MLILKDIVKNYAVGDSSVKALKGVNMRFRKNEFVSILGQSGCGKTTLLNIIGGLDRYTSGDLIINGKSTKTFKDKDWDTYRNHSIGFVFQTYNLIPHQTVLSNVELALTLSGVSPHERKRRAIEALTKVGLEDQLYKKPNQMSGGQMQRVAIARALVNNPDILLADEPTGALDSETSVQIMEILKEISKDKLIIMVTHNPELAEEYSTRIIRLLDGNVVSDSNPYDGEEEGAPAVAEKVKTADKATPKKAEKKKKKSMSFFTALSLSFNNLLTKKGRTVLTSFAGSIGIIGIALILSVSTGVNNYILRIQEETNSSYPITINKTEPDMSGMIATLMGPESGKVEHPTDDDRVYANEIMAELMKNMMNSTNSGRENNLKDFKKDFLENNPDLDAYDPIIQYLYDINLNIYVEDVDHNIVKSDMSDLMSSMFSGAFGNQEVAGQMSSMYEGFNIWEEILSDKNGLVSDTIKSQYDLVDGKWPEEYNEVLLVVNKNNEINDMVIYSLGLGSKDDMIANLAPSAKPDEDDEEKEIKSWSFEDIMGLDLRLVLSPDLYTEVDGGYITSPENAENCYYTKPEKIKIVGIIKPNEDASAAMLQGSLVYTKALTEHVIAKTLEHDLVKEQLENKNVDIFTGKEFAKLYTREEKAAEWDKYVAGLSAEEKAAIFKDFVTAPTDAEIQQAVDMMIAAQSAEELRATVKNVLVSMMQYPADVVDAMLTDEEKVEEYARMIFAEQAKRTVAEQKWQAYAAMTPEELAGAFDAYNAKMTEKQKAAAYDTYVASEYAPTTYEQNMKALGYATLDEPKTIKIFAKTFEDKESIDALIKEYNNKDDNKDNDIEYTDYVALLMSSVTLVINAISYVLIAFVAISLVVSSIMIGIITYISVLERTKEIGILRAIGASKKDISRVFNAETLIVGFGAGAIGIGITVVLNVIISIVIQKLTGIPSLTATLPFVAAMILVGISMALTFIAGLIPSKVAAKKDPVVALRTE